MFTANAGIIEPLSFSRPVICNHHAGSTRRPGSKTSGPRPTLFRSAPDCSQNAAKVSSHKKERLEMHIKGDGKRYIVHSDELLAAFIELEATLV
jgi:hypothetical protein